MDIDERTKVLFLSQPFLFPMDTGGKIRTVKLLEQLAKIFDITLICNFDPAKDEPYLSQLKTLCREYDLVPWSPIKKYSLRFYFRLLTRMFSRFPITVLNDYSKGIEGAIFRRLRQQRYDLLICDFLQPSLNFHKIKDRATLLFQHNVESVIPRRHYEVVSNPLLKLFWWLQWRKMERYEREMCQRFSATVTVSESDKLLLVDKFKAREVYSIPTGVDTAYFSPREGQIKPNSIVFTGSMDWLPNEDAILFFVRDILGRVKQKIPDVTFTVVGRNPSRYLVQELKAYPEVTVTGWVDDVRPYISEHSIYVIPLRIGGGTRIKVYEAMAMGKAVVSTRVGVEGLPVVDGENVILADGRDSFACAIINLLNDDERRRVIECKARDFVHRRFSWETAGNAFAEICRDVVSARRPRLHYASPEVI